MRATLICICLIVASVVMSIPATAEARQALSGASKAMEYLTTQAQVRQLAEARYWHALLHYQKSGIPLSSAVESSVISASFFLARDGRSNPDAELAATIAAMYSPPLADNNQHPQCRFIARYNWLREQLDWNGLVPPPTIRCAQYDAWSKHGNITGVTLVFATGYLSNPASLYGHMLVRFDTHESEKMAGLLDPSMSYGAVVPRNESGVLYMYRGLFGGYDAGFSHDQFFQHHHGYAEEELRDLWEYKLNLSAKDVERLVAHSWELLRVRFRYYFLSDNCASEVNELLALVVDDPLLPDLPWSIPSTILQGLAAARQDNAPLVLATSRIPSRQNRFYETYSTLDATQRSIVRNHIDGVPLRDQNDYQQLDQQRQVATLTALLHYYEFQTAVNTDKDQFRRQRQELLTERFGLPASQPATPAKPKKPPHEGNGPLLLQVVATHNQVLGNGAGLRIRPAYYDLLSLEPGRFPFSSLSMFDLQLLAFDDGLFLRTLDLVSITSLNLSQTGLPGDGGHAWKLRFGLEQQSLACSNCGVFELEGGIGEAISLSDDFTAFAMLDARAQTTTGDYGSLAGGAHAGIVGNWSDRVALSAIAGHRSYANGNFASYPFARAELRLGASREWDVRVRYERNIETEFGVAFSLYW